jgi:hypothetical protein
MGTICPHDETFLNQMKTVDQQIVDYIIDQEHYELTIKNGIIISVPDENHLEAEFTLADIEDGRLSISFYCEQKEFVNMLGITRLQDIYTLTPGSLMELYYEGVAEMVCFVAIEYTYGMNFKKWGNVILATNERGGIHKVPRYYKLETPEQFITYAKRYYTLMECHEN